MRNRSNTWVELAARGQFNCESILVIGENIYTTITAPIIDRKMMSMPLSIGKCVSATLQVSIMTDDDIDTSQPVIVKARLTDGKVYSEWLEFGTFYVDQMKKEYEGLISLTCYDSMLKTDQIYYPVSKLMYVTFKQAIIDIATAIGVEVDERTTIWGKGIINWHTNTYGTFTMRQTLESIAAISGGNWIITEENKLRLVPLITIPNETFDIIDEDYNTIMSTNGDRLVYRHTDSSRPALTPVLNSFDTVGHLNKHLNLEDKFSQWGPLDIRTHNGWCYIKVPDDFDEADLESKIKSGELVNVPVVAGSLTFGKNIVISGVTVTDSYESVKRTYNISDMEKNQIEKIDLGDLSRYVVSVDTSVSINSFLSAAYRAQILCNALIGLIYTPYEATNACLDPAAELGDWVKIGDVRSVIYNMKITLDTCFRCDLSAPSDNKVESLYPYDSKSSAVQTGTSYGGVSISKQEGVTATVAEDDNAVASFILCESDISFNIIDSERNEKQCIYYDSALKKYHISKDVLIDGVNDGTDWEYISLNSDFTAYSTGQKPQYRKIGKVVEIRGAFKATAELSITGASNSYVLGSIPREFAPSQQIIQICQGSGEAVWTFTLRTDGTMSVSRYRKGTTWTNITTDSWLPVQVMYLVD